MLDDFALEELIEPLQTWFAGNARVLPWRENPNPYYVWISEIMLQQTRVEAVKPYFERFIAELPDVKALAACPEDKLLKLWEGLGYYNRVRNLNIAAKQIVTEYDCVMPDRYEELLKLKGIGHYTAGAIASIAFGQPVPAVDGNVLRVISRVTADDSDIMKQSVRSHMEECLRELMGTYAEQGVLKPSVFNQALMELGAMVCLPNGQPHCKECPWQTLCIARRENRIAELPVKTKAKERRIEHRTVFVIRDGERVILGKRPKKGLLAGLYEFPNVVGNLSQKEALGYLKKQGYSPIRILPLPEAKHIFSHVEWHMIGYLVTVSELDAAEVPDEVKKQQFMVEVEDAVNNYAIPTAFSRYAAYMNIPLGK
ncbi:MAG: A/G-specific adenine glycosylase [Agathobacter sp.]|nr:A/G-specific adenine glycosylase [Agathobacter sp.]